MKPALLKMAVLTLMLLGLPLVGLIFSHNPIHLYLEFPPRSLYVDHAPFSWAAFATYTLFILATVVPFLVHGCRTSSRLKRKPSCAFPLWGYGAILFGLIAWVLAWNRFPWFDQFQAHTFTPLWLAYIITINALTYRRTGHCILKDHTARFLALFPVSALFWWFFEYLNRFVQNWSYTGVHFSPEAYFCYATLSFSTVLPAFLSTREWILSFSWPESRFRQFIPIRVSHPKALASAALVGAGAGLVCLSLWPNLLFPLLWVSPLLVLLSLQVLGKEPHIFSTIAHGDWQIIVTSALAALMCGFFWEMWNYYSLAKWTYHIPFVHRFQLFEMPLLGYAGYLPFGLECAVIAAMILPPKTTQ